MFQVTSPFDNTFKFGPIVEKQTVRFLEQPEIARKKKSYTISGQLLYHDYNHLIPKAEDSKHLLFYILLSFLLLLLLLLLLVFKPQNIKY